jgi:hypothetical protein
MAPGREVLGHLRTGLGGESCARGRDLGLATEIVHERAVQVISSNSERCGEGGVNVCGRLAWPGTGSWGIDCVRRDG